MELALPVPQSESAIDGKCSSLNAGSSTPVERTYRVQYQFYRMAEEDVPAFMERLSLPFAQTTSSSAEPSVHMSTLSPAQRHIHLPQYHYQYAFYPPAPVTAHAAASPYHRHHYPPPQHHSMYPFPPPPQPHQQRRGGGGGGYDVNYAPPPPPPPSAAAARW